jgi:hypothetical protein
MKKNYDNNPLGSKISKSNYGTRQIFAFKLDKTAWLARKPEL